MQKVLNQVQATLLELDDEDDVVSPCCFNVLKLEGEVKRVALNEESRMIEIFVTTDRGKRTATYRIANITDKHIMLIKKRKAWFSQITAAVDGDIDVKKVILIESQ
jgi:hypothetical protein